MSKPYYEHAGISIYHGDCRDVLPELVGVDSVVTDPPYGVFLTEKRAKQRGGGVFSRPGGYSFEDISRLHRRCRSSGHR